MGVQFKNFKIKYRIGPNISTPIFLAKENNLCYELKCTKSKILLLIFQFHTNNEEKQYCWVLAHIIWLTFHLKALINFAFQYLKFWHLLKNRSKHPELIWGRIWYTKINYNTLLFRNGDYEVKCAESLVVYTLKYLWLTLTIITHRSYRVWRIPNYSIIIVMNFIVFIT